MISKKTAALHSLAALLIGLTASTSHAYYSTMDTADVTPVDAYRVTLESQYIFNKYDGFNFVGHFATGIQEDSSIEALVGFGEVDFQVGGFYKWAPFPDVDRQPAIGGKIGVVYGRVEDDTQVTLRFHPLISKRFETEIGDITAYGSFPIGIASRDDSTVVPIQAVGGVEWKTLSSENLRFMTELGIDVSKAFSYLSIGLVYTFDEMGLRGPQ